jgi:ELWxxDGT repeat protein
MGARIQKLLVFDNKLFFVSSDTIVNSNLWQDKLYCFSPIKDSIIQLTKNKDYLSCGNQNQNLSYFTIFNNQLYFNSYDSLKGFEMFVTDGTLDGTHLFKDINDSYSCDGGPRFGATNFCKYEDYLFFLGYDSLNGTQLWNTDGINTKLVKEINPNYYNRPYRDQDFIAMLVGKNCLFINYIQQDSLLVGNCGLYIFKKDSICQINFSKDSYHSRFNEYIFIHHDKLYFYRGVDGNNFNLWVTDGTDDGTHIVLAANTKNSLPISFTSLSYNAQHDNRFFSYNGSLYFEANYDSIGFGLYRLDDFDAPVKKVDSTLIEQMLCYPNPTKEILNIKFTTLATESCNLSLTDMYGRIIYTENFTSDASTNTKQINISKFAIGTYVVHLSYPNKSLKTKVEVHK